MGAYFHRPGVNEGMSVVKRTAAYNWKVVTYAVTLALQDRFNHPYEVYLLMGDGKDFDNATVCFRTGREAIEYHNELDGFMRGLDA